MIDFSFVSVLKKGSPYRLVAALSNYKEVYLFTLRNQWLPANDSNYLKRVANGDQQAVEDPDAWKFTSRGQTFAQEHLEQFLDELYEPLLLNTLVDEGSIRDNICRFVSFASIHHQKEVLELLDNFSKLSLMEKSKKLHDIAKDMMSQNYYDEYALKVHFEEIFKNNAVVFSLLYQKMNM